MNGKDRIAEPSWDQIVLKNHKAMMIARRNYKTKRLFYLQGHKGLTLCFKGTTGASENKPN